MTPVTPRIRRPWSLLAVTIGTATVLALTVLTTGPTAGQSIPTPTSTATPAAAGSQPAPAIVNEDAVRLLLPAQFRDATTMPGKWARADMPSAPGGYVVFIATVYPMTDDQGGFGYWLLTNFLQWSGSQWTPGIAGYPGRKLVGDDLWLAQNLYDITALASPPDQSWRVFTVGYSAQGDVGPSLTRSEQLVEMYDLSLTTVWSRLDSQQDIDTSNAGYTKTTTTNVTWSFKDVDGDGIDELVAAVSTATEIDLTNGPAAGLPDAGTVNTTSTETYKWVDGVYVLSRQPAAASTASPTPTPAAPPAATQSTPATTPSPTPTPTATSAVPPRPAAPTTPPSPTPSPGGTPAG